MAPLHLDWALRSDEIVLVVLPEHWVEGCEYIGALFHRFVEAERQAISIRGAGRRVLDLSVVCSRISGIRQGFKVFNQIEVRSHRDLDMVEPGFDLRLHYLGGILNDSASIRRAEKTKSPITTVRPHSPAAQCMIHIAHSLLKPVPERDPRMRFDESPPARFFGRRSQTEEVIPDSKG
jgi:MinD-like ATPase involved in chromosome partitioning or flagellar assembly